jgi:hypothetical protein
MMANYFKEDEARPIVSAWIEQGFEIDRNYILEAIEHDESALSQDVMLSGVAAFGSIASGCLMLALAGFSVPMLIPVAVLAGSGLVAWNSDCAKGDREIEAKFLRDYPTVFDRISQRVNAGEGVATIAAEYGQMFRAYRKSDRAALMQLSATASPKTQADAVVMHQNNSPTGLMNGNPAAQTELQPIAPGVAAAPSMSVVNGVETIAKAAEPDYLARIYQIIDRNNNFFIGGQPGSGKGVMVSNLIRRKLDKYPGSIAVYIDPKGSPREDGNFTDPRITRLKICGVGMSRAEYSIEVAEMLETARGFVDQCDIEKGKHVWIVFDEIMNMKQKLSKDLFGEVQDLLVDCVSMGDDQGLHTIALTQSFNAGDTVGSDELLKNLALIACFKEDDFPRAKKLVQYGKTNYDSYTTEEFSRLVRKSPRKRVICIGGGFIPAPEMPLLSGWDRDKGAKVSSSHPQAVFQTTAIQDDPNDCSDLPDLFEQVMTIAVLSTGDKRSRAKDISSQAAISAKSGDPVLARKQLKDFINSNA